MNWPMLLSLCVLISGCQTHNRSLSNTSGYGLPPQLLPDTRLKTCWLLPPENSDSYRTMLKEYAEAEFNQRTHIEFYGWDLCKSSETDDQTIVRILIYSEAMEDEYQKLFTGVRAEAFEKVLSMYGSHRGHPRVSGLGLFSFTEPVSMIFPMEFDKIKPEARFFLNWLKKTAATPEQGALRIENYQKTVFLHELGHIIGLVHEHAHPQNADLSICNPTEYHALHVRDIHKEYMTFAEKKEYIAALQANYQNELALSAQTSEYLSSKGLLEAKSDTMDTESIMSQCTYYSSTLDQPFSLSDKDVTFINEVLYPASP